VATRKYIPAHMVYTGGTLSCHACLDNLRTPDHGSDQEKIQSLNRHNLYIVNASGKRYIADERDR
jgi:hypothetical protein